MRNNTFYTQTQQSPYPNLWDALIFVPIFAFFVLLASAASQMSAPYHIGDTLPISLEYAALPHYAVRTVLRMFIALGFSLVFSIIFGSLAAKSKKAEALIIPAVDILQSVPILGFLSITIVGFIHLFPGSLLGPECAAIFAIFTSQAWNMMLSVYGSFKSVPADLRETTDVFGLSSWQRFWRLEMPFAMPGLLWNMMVSMSGGWFFLVASEAISVTNQRILLPGVGSYIAVAIDQANLAAVGAAILCMLIVILLYDQLLFRPLLAWSHKFRADPGIETLPSSWLLSLLQRARLISRLRLHWTSLTEKIINCKWFLHKPTPPTVSIIPNRLRNGLWIFAVSTLLLASLLICLQFILKSITLPEIGEVIILGAITAIKIMILIVLVSFIWVPIGVWVGMRPKAAHIVQPIAQFLAAFPANVVFPAAVLLILHFHLNTTIWTSPLMILGTQWHILFNVIAATSMIPKDLHHTTQNLGVKGALWWRTLALPAIFPYYVTGALTAAGGAWNASIVAEWVSWGNTELHATGLGAYIAQHTLLGDFPRIVLGIGVMCIYVIAFNKLLWQRLYRYAQTRYQLE
ncbi:MAG: ABC transporter permease [Gammaproteobacteria bacterium]